MTRAGDRDLELGDALLDRFGVCGRPLLPDDPDDGLDAVPLSPERQAMSHPWKPAAPFDVVLWARAGRPRLKPRQRAARNETRARLRAIKRSWARVRGLCSICRRNAAQPERKRCADCARSNRAAVDRYAARLVPKLAHDLGQVAGKTGRTSFHSAHFVLPTGGYPSVG